MRTDIVILGTGGHGREIRDLMDAMITDGAPFRLLGFLDDDATRSGDTVNGLPVLGTRAWLAMNASVRQVVVGIGSPAARRRAAIDLAALGVQFPVLRHPSAQVGKYGTVASGVVIAAGAVITTNVGLAAHVHVNVTSSVSHDCVLAEYVTLAPGVQLAGGVRLSAGADLGVGASVLPGVQVGEWCVIGAGAVVTKDTPANTTVVGVPARIISKRAPGWFAATS